MSGIGTRRVFVLLGPRIPNETPVSFPNETHVSIGIVIFIKYLDYSPEGVSVAAMVKFRFAIFSSESPKDL